MSVLKICSLILVFTGYYASAQTKKYSCDFENGLCSFLTNVKDNKENWRIGKGKINAADTGPSVDHTIGTANGTYLFVNVSAAKTNAVSLQTVSIKGDYCVRFFYHMYGTDIGSLTVSTQSVSQVSDTKRYFYRIRTQGDRWKETFFTASESGTMKSKGYRITFTAKNYKESSVLGDVAIDDIELTPGKCQDTKHDVTQLCTFDDYDCGYSDSKNGLMKWEWKTQKHTSTYFEKQPENDHTLGTSFGGYWYTGTEGSFFSSMRSAKLSSPVYKKPKSVQNCLHFYYYIDGDGPFWGFGKVNEAYIQLFINFPKSTNGRTWLITKAKNITNHRQWTLAEVKASIPDDFQFQFVSGIDSQVEAVLAIDDIKLIIGNCPEAGFCDFEDDKCNWKDGPNRYDWVRKTGMSGTNSEIGPSVDHTLKTADGNYVVFSTKDKSPGSEADLESEFFPTNDKEMCLTFFYYMSGKDLGTLKVLRREENITESILWLLADDQERMWKRGMAVVKASKMYNQIVFRGVTGEGKNGFMALDDIRIRAGEECDVLPPKARFEDPCTSNPCLNDGNCSVNRSSFECTCHIPFFGERCEYDPCSLSPCLNDGNCTVNENGFKCTCHDPFFGEKCEYDPCSSSPCLNDGNCTVNGNDFKCTCHDPFFGEKCEYDPCSSSPCLNDGNCTVNGNDFKCNCHDPFFGEKCEYDPCSSSPCLKDGNCTVNENDFKCSCQIPFSGDRCQDDPCTDNPCKNGGSCDLMGNSFKCVCEPPYFGNSCEKDLCTDNPCENGGSCMVTGISYKCVCKPPYFGNNCEKDPCTTNPCQNGGICTLDGASFLCHCRNLYSGNLCEKITCNDDVCVNGKCETLGQYYRCRCDAGFTGFRCEDRIPTKSDKQVFWQIIQTSIMFYILLLLSLMFGLRLLRKK